MDDEHDFRRLAMTVLMTPDMANFSGRVHGGSILKLLDQVAYACAARYSGSYVVTMSVDQVVFHQPVHVGELVTFLASVNFTGTSSMEVGIRVTAEHIQGRSERHVMTCYFTMVAVDEHGKPHRAPAFVPATPIEQRRWKAAQLRREFRREIEQRSLDIRLHPDELTTEQHDARDDPC